MECEKDLIRQIIEGEKELFEQIVVTYQNLIFTVCLHIVKDEHDAENMAQETFLSAYRSLSGFRGGDFKSWLCRIAANKSIDFKRKQSKIMVFEEFLFQEAGAGVVPAVGDALEQRERNERMSRILSDMPDKYAAVIKSFYYEGLGVKEIARRRDMPEKTVETRLYRAKKLIKERWGEHVE